MCLRTSTRRRRGIGNCGCGCDIDVSSCGGCCGCGCGCRHGLRRTTTTRTRQSPDRRHHRRWSCPLLPTTRSSSFFLILWTIVSCSAVWQQPPPTHQTASAATAAAAAAVVVEEVVLDDDGYIVDDPDAVCTNTTYCVETFGDGSVCDFVRETETKMKTTTTGLCTNPYAQGCLRRLLPDYPQERLRVCNSDDSNQVGNKGQQGQHDGENSNDDSCRIPQMDDVEVRIASRSWVSPVHVGWILQIVYSEILGIPATIESFIMETEQTTRRDHGSFYAPVATKRLPYERSPNGYAWYNETNGYGAYIDAVLRGAQLQDCRLVQVDAQHPGGTKHRPFCAHVLPEAWNTPSDKNMAKAIADGFIEVKDMGAIGQEGWYVPLFTLKRDPTIGTWLGLQNNRRKLADMFLRPTTWTDYCNIVSENNCSTPDHVARRAPKAGTEEETRMFVEDLYTGHFRETEQNNCTLNPNSCTGHFADYPCDWFGKFPQLSYHLNISLESNGPDGIYGGYTYTQLPELWDAANATKSNLIMMYWAPEAVHQKYRGTDNELTRITLPPSTQKCLKARVGQGGPCIQGEDRFGKPEGACDCAPQGLTMQVSTGLYNAVHKPDVSDVIKSPAYDFLDNFKISELQIDELSEYKVKYKTHHEAVCRWVVDNIDFLKAQVPKTQPRVLQEYEGGKILVTFALVIASVATALMLLTSWQVYMRRIQQAFRLAQIEFLAMLLAGSLMVCVGAIILCIKPSNQSCTAIIWLVDIGYTLSLIPLIIKINATNRLMRAARRFRRVTLKRVTLFQNIFLISIGVIIFLTLWTVLEPPRKEMEYELTDSVTDEGDTIVQASPYCHMNAPFQYISIGWIALLLIIASLLAFQTRHLVQDFNESQTLGILAYSHFFFVVLRLVTMFLSEKVNASILQWSQSLIYSSDSIASVIIYFLPKFLAEDVGDISRFGSMSHFVVPQPRQANELGILAHINRYYHPSTIEHDHPDEATSDSLPPKHNDDKEIGAGSQVGQIQQNESMSSNISSSSNSDTSDAK